MNCFMTKRNRSHEGYAITWRSENNDMIFAWSLHNYLPHWGTTALHDILEAHLGHSFQHLYMDLIVSLHTEFNLSVASLLHTAVLWGSGSVGLELMLSRAAPSFLMHTHYNSDTHTYTCVCILVFYWRTWAQQERLYITELSVWIWRLYSEGEQSAGHFEPLRLQLAQSQSHKDKLPPPYQHKTSTVLLQLQ